MQKTAIVASVVSGEIRGVKVEHVKANAVLKLIWSVTCEKRSNFKYMYAHLDATIYICARVPVHT